METSLDNLDLLELSRFLFSAIDKFVGGIEHHFQIRDEILKDTDSKQKLQLQIAVKLNEATDCILAVLQLLNAKEGVPVSHFYVFDKVAYFLMKYEKEINLTAWTDICH